MLLTTTTTIHDQWNGDASLQLVSLRVNVRYAQSFDVYTLAPFAHLEKRITVTWHSLNEPSLFGLCSIYLIWRRCRIAHQKLRTRNISSSREKISTSHTLLEYVRKRHSEQQIRTSQCMRTTLSYFFLLRYYYFFFFFYVVYYFLVSLLLLYFALLRVHRNLDVVYVRERERIWMRLCVRCCCLYFSCVHQKTFAIVDLFGFR